MLWTKVDLIFYYNTCCLLDSRKALKLASRRVHHWLNAATSKLQHHLQSTWNLSIIHIALYIYMIYIIRANCFLMCRDFFHSTIELCVAQLATATTTTTKLTMRIVTPICSILLLVHFFPWLMNCVCLYVCNSLFQRLSYRRCVFS